jgi:hypothetical protein
MSKFFYVYILESETDRARFYVGFTDDVRKRVRNHDAGRVLHSAKWRLGEWTLTSDFLIAIGRRNLSGISNQHPVGHLRKSIYDQARTISEAVAPELLAEADSFRFTKRT